MSEDKNKRIIIAGKEYASSADMPPELRRVYELARNSQNLTDEGRVKIVYHGTEYPNIDAMPPEVRKKYEHEQAAMETFRDFTVDSTVPRALKVDQVRRQDAPTRPAGTAPAGVKWLVIAVMVIAVVAVAVFVVLKGGH